MRLPRQLAPRVPRVHRVAAPVVLAAALTVSGCSGDGEEPEDDATASAEAETGEEAPEDGGDAPGDGDANGAPDGFGPVEEVPDTRVARRLQSVAEEAGRSVPDAADYTIEGSTLRFRIDGTGTDESTSDVDDCTLVRRAAEDIDLPRDATIVIVYDDAEFACEDA